MNFLMVIYLLGYILICVGGLMLLPALVAVIYGEACLSSFLITAAISIFLGFIIILKKPKNKIFHLREGYVITALSWIIISLVGALPFVLSGAIPNYIDALFEIISGFTTTGASILPEVESLPHAILFWRSFTHWIGGMGVLVFLLALLPLSGGSNMNLMKAESPGPQVGKLVPKLRSTASILYIIYLGITIIEIVVLLIARMPLFDTLTITFGTVGTGGFGVRNDSCASYTITQQVIITIFMIASGINFNAYFFILLRKFKKAFDIEEVRVYLIFILVSTLLIAFNSRSMFSSMLESIQQAAFQVGSVITTTGYSSCDYNLWPSFSKNIIILLMISGACAGSTGGGVKVSRIIILVKSIIKEVKHVIHPQSVSNIRMDGKAVAHETIRSTNVFLVSYILIFIASVSILSIEGYPFETNFTAVLATFNNIGPGLDMVGPSANFSFYSPISKLVMSFDMLAGRLEIFPMLVLFSRHTWQRF